MNLLRNFTILSVASMLLFGCAIDSADDYDPDYMITFQPAIGIITKSSESSVYPESSTFGVWAFQLGGGKTWAEYSANATVKLDDAKVSFMDGVWKTSDGMHWGHSNERLTFFAYSPSSLAMRYDASKGMCLDNFDVSKDATDILFSDVIQDRSKREVAGRVAIPFRHALSRVQINISYTGLDEDGMMIKSIKVGGIAQSGSFHSLPAGWDVSADRKEIELVNEPFMLERNSRNLIDMAVIPQIEARPVTIVYDEYMDGDLTAENKTIEINPIRNVWDLGKHYIYSIFANIDNVTYKTDVLDYL